MKLGRWIRRGLQNVEFAKRIIGKMLLAGDIRNRCFQRNVAPTPLEVGNPAGFALVTQGAVTWHGRGPTFAYYARHSRREDVYE
jgi:hypothetical protein